MFRHTLSYILALISLHTLVLVKGDDLDRIDSKWEKYLKLIQNAEHGYKGCSYDSDMCSSCHYKQIQADLKPWSDGITEDLLDQANQRAVKYQIINHKLYRAEKCVFEARCEGVEYFLTKLLPDLPDTQFMLNVFDYPCTLKNHPIRSPVLSFSKDSSYMDIMYPAWTFWSGGPAVWPIYPRGQGDWEGTRKWLIDVAENTYPWSKKTSRGFFIGSRTSAERDPLILLSRSKPDLVNAAYTKNQAYKGPQDTLNAEPVEPKKYDEHCAYKYLFNFRGVAASFRFKHLFLCNSLVYHVGEEWLEFFYPALKPWIHYIPVKIDLSNTQELLEFAQENNAISKRIANRGFSFIKDHVRQEDVFCYWKKLILEYSKLLKFKPQLDSELKYIAG